MYLSGLLIVYSGAIIKQLTIISPLRVHALLHLPFLGANNGAKKPHQVASNQKAGTLMAQLEQLAKRGGGSDSRYSLQVVINQEIGTLLAQLDAELARLRSKAP